MLKRYCIFVKSSNFLWAWAEEVGKLLNIGVDLHFLQGGLKKLMTIPNGSCRCQRIESGLAKGLKVIFPCIFHY